MHLIQNMSVETFFQLPAHTVFILVCCLVLLLFVTSVNGISGALSKGKWLNGPYYFPFWGSGIQVAVIGATRSLNDTITELCKRYGEICGVWGSMKNYFVFVNGAEVAKKILLDVNFEGKFPQSSWDSLMYGKPNLGILHAFGPTATELRSRSISKLRKYGYGSPHFANLIKLQVGRTLEAWENQRKQKDGVVQLDKYSFVSEMADILWHILIGSSFPGSPEQFKQIVDGAEKSLNQRVKQFVLLYAYKYLRFIPNLTMYQNTKEWFEQTEEILKNVLAERKKNAKYKHVQENVLDSFLFDLTSNPHPEVTEEQIVWVINDLQLVGVTGLAANSLQWAILYLCLNPQVLEKMTMEIQDILGFSNPPDIEQRSKMPYTECVILETIRMGNVVNYAMRSNLKDVCFEGCHIPGESVVMVDTECLRKNPMIWDDPNSFCPERFYCEESRSLINVEKLNAFGFKRPCLGENIVKQTNFIFLVHLIQRYKISISSKFGLPTTQSQSGIIGKPEPFRIVISPRASL